MKSNQTSTAERPSDILDELHALVTKAEKIISQSLKSDTGIAQAMQERFRDSRDQMTEIYSEAKDQILEGAKRTDKAIHANPYQSLAIAAGVGVLIGLLAGRSSSRE